MGRQAYLTKLAFGRSAFEPTSNATQSEDFVQLESVHSELPRRYQEFNGNNYVQLYDERGNPMNPRSRDHGKSLRNAQNDVLAAVGVVERRRSPADDLPGAYEERLDELDVEDTVGGVLGSVSAVTQQLCTWWIGSIRDRVLTFRYHDAMPFARIIATEHAVSGTSILHAGLVPTLLATIGTQTVFYYTLLFQPVVRFMNFSHASSRIRKLHRLSKPALKFGLHFAVGLFFYPFAYHADLQRLALIPAKPYLPPWSAFNPFSDTSPFTPLSRHYDVSASPTDFCKPLLTSPAILACAGQLLERWMYAKIFEAVESSIICPDNPDVASPDLHNRYRILTTLGLRQPSPPSVRKAIRRLMVAIGWGTRIESSEASTQLIRQSAQPLPQHQEATIDVAGTTVRDVAPLHIPVAQHHTDQSLDNLDADDMLVTAVNDLERPMTPVSPSASILQHDTDDPRIRITSREGIVEMEVRLPPRTISTHTEVADALGSVQVHLEDALTRHERPHHRVSKLSLLPADKISSIVKAHLVGIAVLPLRLIVMRLVAAHYLGGAGTSGSARTALPIPRIWDLSLRSVGTQVSRLALSNVLHVAIDLSVWGLQYVLTLNLGKSLFGWGDL